MIPFATPWPTPWVSGLVTALATASQTAPDPVMPAFRGRLTNRDYERLAKTQGIVEAP